jgi:hypothetical protein
LVFKHAGAINIEQYNKLSIKCAFVCLFVRYAYSKRMRRTMGNIKKEIVYVVTNTTIL